jgi:hypothetical protein
MKQELSTLIQNNWNTIIRDFNQHINNTFEIYHLQSYREYFKDNKTQEITKEISPLFNTILCKNLKQFGFLKCEINGSDYIFNNVNIEGKLTLSSGNNWTGNGYKKTNLHLLMKLNLNENGNIDSSFCCIIPLDESISNWSLKTKSSNFVNLKLLKEDISNIILINGEFKPLKKNSKYLTPLLK